jgi:hypothetical protein
VKSIETSIDIAAPTEAVWAALTDFGSYPGWNPFIPSIEGAPAEGARLKVRLRPPGRAAMTFRPTVLEANPGRRLRWLGKLGVRGLFDGEHRFDLEPLPGGRTRFTQAERFAGLLVPLFSGTLADTRRGFEEMNAALKARVEQPTDHAR